MDKQISLTPFEQSLKTILDVPGPDTEFVRNTRARILRMPQPAQPQKNKVPFHWNPAPPAWAWAAAVVTLVMMLIFLAVGPDRVLASARNWLGGFIPDVGFIQSGHDSNLRILEKPVQISVKDAAIVVEKAFTNANETNIQIHYLDDSRACKNTNITSEEYRSRLNENVYLLLPDGRKLFALTPRFSNWGKFPALPDGVNEVVLVIPSNVLYTCNAAGSTSGSSTTTFCQCLDDDLRWLIQLKFIPPPPGSILPVVDNATTTPPPAGTAAPSLSALSDITQTPSAALTATPAAGPQPELVGKLVQLEDGYLIMAALKRDPNALVSYSFGLNQRHYQLFDASGSEIPVEEVERSEVNSDAFKDFEWGDTLLLRTHTGQITGPLTLTFQTLVRSQYQYGQESEFIIDLGTELQPGQRIPIQKSFDFISGYPFSLREVAIDNLTSDAVGVTLTFDGQGYETILINQLPLSDLPPQGGSSGQCAEFTGCFFTSTSLTPGTNGQYHLAVSGEEHAVPGPWSLTFEPGQTAP